MGVRRGGARGRPLVQMRGLGGCCPVQNNIVARAANCIRSISNISFSVTRKRALNLINRSKYNGSAINERLINLRAPANNELFCRKGSVRGLSKGRGGDIQARLRVIFRSPCSSLGPEGRVCRVLSRPVLCRKVSGGRAIRESISQLLSVMKLPGRILKHCPRRFSNKRQREVKVTQTLSLGPEFLIYSRPIDTLSISVRTRVLGLLHDLRGSLKLAYVFIKRKLNTIGCIDSQVTIVCLNGVIRVKPTRRIFRRPMRPCAHTLVSTIPVTSPGGQRRGPLLAKRVNSDAGPPSNYHFRPEYPCTARDYERRIPRLYDVFPNDDRLTTYPCTITRLANNTPTCSTGVRRIIMRRG